MLIAYVGDIIPYANELVQFFGKVFNPVTELVLLHVSNYHLILVNIVNSKFCVYFVVVGGIFW